MADFCALIINPVSGHYSERKIREIAAMLVSHGLNPELLLTRGPDDATRFSRRICEEHGEPLIIAGGGDGTVNGVVNGLVPGKATIAVLPLGTANVLAKELGIRSIDDAVRRIVRGETRPLSAGLLKAGGLKRYFLLMAGIGFDGFVVEGVRGNEKKLLKEGAYILSALRRLRNWEKGQLEVLADGRRMECHSLIICNAAKYGGKFLLAPRADIFSPEFQVVCIKSDARTALLKLVLSTLLGKTGETGDVLRFTTSELAISGAKAVQVDGDFCCYSPVKIRAVAGFARLVI
ncbi:MAG: diacylglycerol kinase catalytic [Geobacteraceae bacterium]|nr:MAG: diacylglycerol kinase catalytic [Geobacteraceae bacterium]